MAENETMMFNVETDKASEAREILTAIYRALKEKGYNPYQSDCRVNNFRRPYIHNSQYKARSIIGGWKSECWRKS
jgi:uncharacterized protein (UPF0297 family)